MRRLPQMGTGIAPLWNALLAFLECHAKSDAFRTSVLLEPQEMQAEEPVFVGPGLPWRPAGGTRQGLELSHRIFMRILGVDALAPSETELMAEQAHRLAGKAH